jgi:hypothetical protein
MRRLHLSCFPNSREGGLHSFLAGIQYVPTVAINALFVFRALA